MEESVQKPERSSCWLCEGSDVSPGEPSCRAEGSTENVIHMTDVSQRQMSMAPRGEGGGDGRVTANVDETVNE